MIVLWSMFLNNFIERGTNKSMAPTVKERVKCFARGIKRRLNKPIERLM